MDKNGRHRKETGRLADGQECTEVDDKDRDRMPTRRTRMDRSGQHRKETGRLADGQERTEIDSKGQTQDAY